MFCLLGCIKKGPILLDILFLGNWISSADITVWQLLSHSLVNAGAIATNVFSTSSTSSWHLRSRGFVNPSPLRVSQHGAQFFKQDLEENWWNRRKLKPIKSGIYTSSPTSFSRLRKLCTLVISSMVERENAEEGVFSLTCSAPSVKKYLG